MRQLMSTASFRAKFSNLASNDKVTRVMMQDLIEDALLQASAVDCGGHGSCARLTIIVQGLTVIKSMPTRVIQKYIAAHAAVKWCKLSDGVMGYKFIDKPSVTMPTVTYWDWSGNENKTAKVDVDVVAMLKSIKTKVAAAHKKEGKVDHENLLPEIDKLIAKATAQVHDTPFNALAPVEDEATV
jgi:hypothetical protein